MTIRVAPPADVSKGVNNITVHGAPGGGGRNYNVAVGSTQDVPDHDAFALVRNGWLQLGEGVGTTAQRPATGIAKDKYWVDTTLNAAICWDGKQWRNCLTGAVV